MNKKDITAPVATAAILGLILASLVFLTLSAINKSERAECLKWKAEALEYGARYYLTQWQKDQCDAHQIPIKARTKNAND